MVHHRQRLTLGFEAGDELPGVHAALDDLHGNAAFHRAKLLGHENRAHATFAELLQESMVVFYRTMRELTGFVAVCYLTPTK